MRGIRGSPGPGPGGEESAMREGYQGGKRGGCWYSWEEYYREYAGSISHWAIGEPGQKRNTDLEQLTPVPSLRHLFTGELEKKKG